MKTYEQGKAELDAEIKKLNNAIKDAKQNITFDFYCPQCNKTKKLEFIVQIMVERVKNTVAIIAELDRNLSDIKLRS